MACHFGLNDIVKMLLDKQADVNIQANDGLTALMIASQEGHNDIVKMLIAEYRDLKKLKYKSMLSLAGAYRYAPPDLQSLYVELCYAYFFSMLTPQPLSILVVIIAFAVFFMLYIYAR